MHQQWGCDHCRQMLGPVAQGRAQPMRGGAAPAVAVPFCPRCWTPGTWHEAAGKFGCDKCRTLLDAAPANAPVVPPNAITNPHHMKSDAGSAFGKVVLWIVVIGVLVAIKLAVRGALR